MSPPIALLDANVLYPAPIRDLMLQIAVDGLFRARWSDDIQREWIDALLRNEPHRDRTALERTRALMDAAVRDCVVTGYASLIPTLALPDEQDRHVLAAAIAGRCDLIVTQNLKDFPESAVAPFGIDVRHPDAFLGTLLELAPRAVCAAVQKVRARLAHPPYGVADYLAILEHQGLVASVAALRPLAALL